MVLCPILKVYCKQNIVMLIPIIMKCNLKYICSELTESKPLKRYFNINYNHLILK